MDRRRNGVLTDVPVKIRGVIVGTARVNPNGSISIMTLPNTPLGREMWRLLETGYSGDFSLALETVPKVT